MVLVSDAQVRWDDIDNKDWPLAFKKVTILSSFDGTLQPSIVYSSTLLKPQPLIVSLHSWSGDYMQSDSLSFEISRRNWNYIHPDFRGPNNKPIACGSTAAVQDIDDAIKWAIEHMRVDTNEIHIVGTSGGGFMAMQAYMKLKYPVKSFSSWVGISDLETWYHESIGRQLKYAKDIQQCTGSTDNLNVEEARARSPFYEQVPNRKATLHLFAGIHDGYLGSVPITQSMKMYNKIVNHYFPQQKALQISDSKMIELLSQRKSTHTSTRSIGGRNLHYYANAGPVSIVIFEGKHEMIVPVGLQMLPIGQYNPFGNKQLLAIGDSNGAAANGWVNWMQNIQPSLQILNRCKPGRTFGFDNNNDTSLNELRLVKSQLNEALTLFADSFDAVVISLGTNDVKNIFADSQHIIISKCEQLLAEIASFSKVHQPALKTILVLPAPINEAKDGSGKFVGATLRLQQLRKELNDLALRFNAKVVDAFQLLKDVGECTTDGVHLTALSQQLLGNAIAESVYH